MNSKKVNRLFLITVIIYLCFSLGAGVIFPQIIENMIASNVLIELAVLIPAMMFLFCAKENPRIFLRFHKIKFTSVIMILVFTFLFTPFMVLVNLLSQFLVENEVTQMIAQYDILSLPFWQVFLLIGVFAPICEEIVCRGVYYQGHKKTVGAFWALLLSSFLFACIHMNLNQAAYTFVMGIAAVLLVEATGSIWSTIIFHIAINGSQVGIMYLSSGLNPDAYSNEVVHAVTSNMLLYSVTAYLVIAAITLPLAWAVLVWICNNETNRGILLSIWAERKNVNATNKKDKMITVSLVIALILCVSFITLNLLLSKMV